MERRIGHMPASYRVLRASSASNRDRLQDMVSIRDGVTERSESRLPRSVSRPTYYYSSRMAAFSSMIGDFQENAVWRFTVRTTSSAPGRECCNVGVLLPSPA